ncbi:MAG: FAD-dependent oxidoreductase [Planctomycetes bacterium]|nr:FAD-dependent oxidoreductase [Planctomycetota bacterium]
MPDAKTYDIIICGGGVAGVTAALHCARSGLSVAMIEKTIFPGGLATSGLINIYLPICNNKGRQVMHGLPEELLKASIKYGPGDIPEDWSNPDTGSRYQVSFSPASFIIAMDELLENEEKIDLWLDTLFCKAVMDGDKITGVEVENKSGRITLKAPIVIDATGDGDVAVSAGAPMVEGENWHSIWAIQNRVDDNSHGRSALPQAVRLGANDSGKGHPEGGKIFTGISGRKVSEFTMITRRMLREYYQKKIAAGGDRNETYPVTLPNIPQFRMTRRIDGLATLKNDGFDQKMEDSVGLIPDWYNTTKVWEMPYKTLLPQKVKGLLVTGRCMSAETFDAWRVTRVIPTASMTGQIAAIASTIALNKSCAPHEVCHSEIQAKLDSMGIQYHI